MSKEVNIILALCAHQPLWDLPGALLRGMPDQRMASALVPENYMRKRFTEGRNIFRDLMALITGLGVSVALGISNEFLHQIKGLLPRTFEDLKEAYQRGFIYPLYTPAHQAHPAFLTDEEIMEEIRLNQQFLHRGMGVPLPRYKGLVFPQGSIDPRLLPAIEGAGIDYIIFPAAHDPFMVGGRTMALPRHPLSQEIWRPVLRWYPKQASFYGYMLGEYYVFDTEYSRERYLESPIDRKRAVAEYTNILAGALEKAPPGGLILYIQDLEMLDFGDSALDVMGEAWERLLDGYEYKLNFTTPDDYIDAVAKRGALPRMEVGRASWVPEILVTLRSDGHYPPEDPIFKRHPLIFWEAGKFLLDLFSYLMEAFEFPTISELDALLLSEEDYQFQRFPYEKRLPMHLRLMKRSNNWGWRPGEEGKAKEPYLHGYLLADGLILLLKLYPERPLKPKGALDERSLKGLEMVPEVLLDTRIDYITYGLVRERDALGFDPAEALRELGYAKEFRTRAGAAVEKMKALSPLLYKGPAIRDMWQSFLMEAREHCRSIFLSLDHIQRAWEKSGDLDFMRAVIYKYLYQLYPPKLPKLLEEIGV